VATIHKLAPVILPKISSPPTHHCQMNMPGAVAVDALFICPGRWPAWQERDIAMNSGRWPLHPNHFSLAEPNGAPAPLMINTSTLR
jgi:hypothetical protein